MLTWLWSKLLLLMIFSAWAVQRQLGVKIKWQNSPSPVLHCHPTCDPSQPAANCSAAAAVALVADRSIWWTVQTEVLPKLNSLFCHTLISALVYSNFYFFSLRQQQHTPTTVDLLWTALLLVVMITIISLGKVTDVCVCFLIRVEFHHPVHLPRPPPSRFDSATRLVLLVAVACLISIYHSSKRPV